MALTAVPNEGFVFSHWEPTGNESPIVRFRMPDGDRTRTAVFIPFDPNSAVSQPPKVTIVSPTRNDATQFENAERILFSGTAVDPEDGNLTGGSFVWVSNIDGQIGTGESFTTVLSTGHHTITLIVTDSRQVEGADAVIAIVAVAAPDNGASAGGMTSPTSGDEYLTTDTIHFTGAGHDQEDGTLTGASLVWASNIDGEIGTGESLDATLSEGNHRISLTISDRQQKKLTVMNDIVVEMLVNEPPIAAILSPLFGESALTFLTADSIDFNGVANDPEDGVLPRESIVWESDLDGQIGIGESISASLSPGVHNITLTATDSQQAEAAVSISITVAAPVPTATPAPTATPVPQPVPLPAREAGLALSLFTGTATLNGYLVPDGTVVTAWVADFSEPVATAVVADGQYVVSVFQYGKKSFAGKIITFEISGIKAQQTGSWESFGAEVLNLTASGS